MDKNNENNINYIIMIYGIEDENKMKKFNLTLCIFIQNKELLKIISI